MIRWREGRVTASGGSGPAPSSWTCDVADAGRRAGAVPGRWPTPALVGRARGRRPGAAQHHRPGARAGHRRLRPGRRAAGPAARRRRRPAAGHLVKARYTPLQAMVLGVDEQESPHHERARATPTTCSACPSSWPTCTRRCRPWSPGCGRAPPDARVAYVMTDGGALPAWFSRTVAGLRAAGWLAASVTVGQAFGGDLEAVTRAQRRCWRPGCVAGADVAVVAQGPGNLGTGTRWGFSGVAAGEAINAAAVLGGRPVAALRVSGGRPPGAAPRRVAPQPDRVRPGGAGPGRRRRAAAAGDAPFGRRAVREQAAAAGRAARPAPAGRGRPSTGLRRGAGDAPGAAVDDGPRPGRGPGGVPGRRRRRPARGRACSTVR